MLIVPISCHATMDIYLISKEKDVFETLIFK